MRKVAPIVFALGLLICISPLPQPAKTASQNSIGDSSFASTVRSGQDGIVTSDVTDSDEFLQDAIRARGPEHDYSQKIESLLKQMTVKEKVGQMTQLTLEMIVSGHDQSIQIDPAKLQKAIGQYGVGSILNCYRLEFWSYRESHRSKSARRSVPTRLRKYETNRRIAGCSTVSKLSRARLPPNILVHAACHVRSR